MGRIEMMLLVDMRLLCCRPRRLDSSQMATFKSDLVFTAILFVDTDKIDHPPDTLALPAEQSRTRVEQHMPIHRAVRGVVNRVV